MPNNKYANGAAFERKIIKALLEDVHCPFVIRGAGSKSYGSIKADITAISPNGKMILVQAKNSDIKYEKEKEDFYNNIYNLNLKLSEDGTDVIIGLWTTPKTLKKDIEKLNIMILFSIFEKL